jgi:hypothetical protein
LRNLDPKPPVQRYEREHPGDLIHIDAKNSPAFAKSATASPVTGSRADLPAPAKTVCTLRSTMPPDWPT